MRGGGSKAVWKFSKNSPDLVAPPFSFGLLSKKTDRWSVLNGWILDRDCPLTVTTTRAPAVPTKLSYKTKTRYLSSPILSEIFHSPVTASIFSDDKFIETHFNQSGLLLTWAIFSFQPYHVKLSSLQPMERAG